MEYLGQKYDKGIVIQRSSEGSAFQEDVEVTVEGEQELTPKVGGGFKKVTVNGAGGSEVIPNPEMEGDEPELTGLEVDGDKYKVPEGTAVEANPTLEGNEAHLSSLEIDGTVYDLDGKIYDKNNIVNMATIDYDTAANRAHVEIAAEATDSEAIAVAGAIEERIEGTFTSAEAYLRVDISDEEMSAVKAGVEIDAETGDPRTYVKINADEININGNENGAIAEINIGGENDTVNINGQPYSHGTEVIANPTMSGSEPNLTGLQVGNNKYKVPQGGGASLGVSDDLVFKTGNLKKNIIAYFSQKYQLNVDDTTDFMLTSRVGDLAEDGGTISVGTSFHYIDVNTAISAGVGGSMTYAYQPTNMSDFELSLSEGEYGSGPIASLVAGRYIFSGAVSSTQVSTHDAFQALDFTENYYSIDNIISLIFHNSDEPNIIGISWQRNEEYGTETESLSIKDLLDCFEPVEGY